MRQYKGVLYCVQLLLRYLKILNVGLAEAQTHDLLYNSPVPPGRASAQATESTGRHFISKDQKKMKKARVSNK